MMPRMSGDRLVSELRRCKEFDEVPVILLTAKADDDLRVRLLQEGAQDYLHKPFDTPTVLAKVERLVTDRRRRQNAEEALHRLSGGLLEAQDRERRHVARELNEHIAQCLAALGIYLQMAKSPGAQSEIEEGMAVLERCVADVRSLSQTLHPLILDNLGLRAAIEWHVAGFTSGSGIPVRLQAPRGFGRLPADSELALFRVLQDALGRVREAGGSAEVRAFRDGIEAGIEVAAKGAVPAPGAEDLNLAATRERLRQLGGRLELNGSTLRAVVPAPDANP
jgi:signal transduction histidine kinase